MGGFEKVALKKAADYAALEFRKTMVLTGGAQLCLLPNLFGSTLDI